MADRPERPAAGEEADSVRVAGDKSTRREFLKTTAAVTGASLLGGCIVDNDNSAAPATQPVQRFEHFVVVMFENRSLDNLLGYLLPAGRAAAQPDVTTALPARRISNPVPAYINDGHALVSTRVSPGTDADMSNPNPDPGEEYQHVNTQLFGIVDPPEQRSSSIAARCCRPTTRRRRASSRR